MSFKPAIFGASTLVFLASSAGADVNAKDIWADWKAYMSSVGNVIEATETMSGDTLKITDLKLSMPMPEVDGNFEMSFDTMSFVQNGDGTVSLVFPKTMPMEFSATNPDGGIVSGTLEYTMGNMDMRVSGDPSVMTYDYSTDEIKVALTELTIEDEALASEDIKISMTAQDLQGQTIMEPGALRKIAQTMTMGTTSYQVMFNAPDDEGAVNIDGTVTSFNYNGDTFLPSAMDPENVAAALQDGFALAGSFGYTGANTNFTFSDGRDTMSGSSSSDAAAIGVQMSKDKLQYNGSSKGVKFALRGEEIPFPIDASFGEVAFNLMVPVSKSDAESDFALGITLGDFETSDILWSLVDGEKVLPRDPATISFDVTGKAKMLVDFFDPEQMIALEDGEMMPAEVTALSLNNLLVSAAGAKLSGTGDFTFDNSDLESFGGIPKPTGGVKLNLVGGNGLMDKLVQLGVLPQEQAMAGRMMMGLFTRPGPGDDEVNTSIDINEQGHILANGQRLK